MVVIQDGSTREKITLNPNDKIKNFRPRVAFSRIIIQRPERSPDKLNLRGQSYELTHWLTKRAYRVSIGRCEICTSRRELVVDHEHAFDWIRGVLCSKCNSWLGVIENDLRRGRRKRIHKLSRKLKKLRITVYSFVSYLKERNRKGYAFEF